MGSARIDNTNYMLTIHAMLIFYGNAANQSLSEKVAGDVENYWNEPKALLNIRNASYQVQFFIKGIYAADITEIDVYENVNPRNNYFRVEEFATGNISFVDGINSNTGYFKLDNLLNNSGTAAHEFGHTIGLRHPDILDIRGHGTPGIMYPRGTIVDPVYQYDPAAAPLQPGGTMNPSKRKVLSNDIADLRLHALNFNPAGFAVLGAFSSVWHDAHQP
ncbi:MAG: peptidase M10 [Ferruginibacter sp.]|nr:peptidase M10 [Ferruginibacter sp.]